VREAGGNTIPRIGTLGGLAEQVSQVCYSHRKLGWNLLSDLMLLGYHFYASGVL
jgi:hypothetical protein